MTKPCVLLPAMLLLAFSSRQCCAFVTTPPPSSGRRRRRRCTDGLHPNKIKQFQLQKMSTEDDRMSIATITTTTTTSMPASSNNSEGALSQSSEEEENHSVTFNDRLLELVQSNDTSTITVDAYVLSKRSLGKNLIFCDFQIASSSNEHEDDDDNDDSLLCQAMLRREYYRDPDNYEGYKRCLLRGTKLQITGEASPTRIPGNVVLLIHSMKLLSVPRQQQHIQALIQLAYLENILNQTEVALACHQSSDSELFQKPLLPANLEMDEQQQQLEEKKWSKQLAKHVLKNLPDDKHYPKAADQVKFSKLGNFVRPAAPKEWQQVPHQLLDGRSNNHADDVAMLHMISVNTTLEEFRRLANTDSSASSVRVSLQGSVQNRRRFDRNITMISLVDELAFLSKAQEQSVVADRLVAIVHPNVLQKTQCAGLYSNIAAVETKVQVTGKLLLPTPAAATAATPTLWVEEIRLVQSSSRSATIRLLLDVVHEQHSNGNNNREQVLDLEEVAEALKLPFAAAVELPKLDPIQRQWKANQLAVQLQQSKRNVVEPELLQVMEKYKLVSQEFPIVEVTNDETDALPSRPTNLASPVIGMPGTKWQSKKRPQLEWMGKQIQTVLESHPEYGKRTLRLLDIGGGKGLLANYLGKALADKVNIHVVDICEGAIANGRKKAQRYNLPVQFVRADASQDLVMSGQAKQDENNAADVVVALHACGHLSDIALGHAVHYKAGFVIVPCCFNSNPHLTMPYKIEHDGDEDISVPFWLGIPPDDWSALKLLAEVQGDVKLASEATAIICALRAKAIAKHLSTSDARQGRRIEIRRFPVQYSTRNTVLVGKCS